MPAFFIDNTQVEAGYHRIYKVENSECSVCKLAYDNKNFYKDLEGRPFYFQAFNHETAIMFCGAVHSNEWSRDEENKKKIWNHKDGI
jgi:hypothetical protein